jgi:16S rRNA (adenine1518-N6/adenine1519-N6)-dimethyltransferase
LVRLGFAEKRKMLRNNLKAISDRFLTVTSPTSVKEQGLTDVLEKLNINPQARAEELSLAQWVALSNCLQDGEGIKS